MASLWCGSSLVPLTFCLCQMVVLGWLGELMKKLFLLGLIAIAPLTNANAGVIKFAAKKLVAPSAKISYHVTKAVVKTAVKVLV